MTSRALIACVLTAGAVSGTPLRTAFAQGTSAALSVAERVRERIAAGDRESAARRSAAALAHFDEALALDGRNFDALWRASREAVDIGETEANATRRTALYARAAELARRATVSNPNDAEGYFHLARALGRTALDVGVRERVKYAMDIRTYALRALSLSPRHPGALHVMGVWNAEVMRLSGMSRMVARTFLGGQVFASASWPEATRYMEQSVAVEPNRLVHQLDLARVYRDTKRVADARAAYQAALRAPLTDANDDRYRRTAEQELRALR